MKRIVVVGDVHDQRERLEVALALAAAAGPADLVVLTGDLGRDPAWNEPARSSERDGHDASVRHVVERAPAALAAPLVFVPGNHDLAEAHAGVAAANVDGRVLEIGGFAIGGFGGAGPGRFGFPYEWSEQEADQALARAFGEREAPLDLLLVHTPPRDTALDVTRNGEHVGSRSVLRWIKRLRPRLFVCGHIHEAFGVERVWGVPCLNAGSLGEPYGREIVWTVDWADGPLAIHALEPGAERRSWRLAP